MKSLKRGKSISEPEITNITQHGFWIFLNGKEYFIAFDQFPWFKRARINELSNVQLCHGSHLYWPDLDVDLSVDIIEHPDHYKLVANEVQEIGTEYQQRLIKLRIPPDDAQKILRMVNHRKYLDALESHWKIFEDGHPQAQSICWLFCWAKAGVKSKRAAQEARDVFNRLFDKPFEWFDRRVPHNWARDARYKKDNIEAELEHYLKKLKTD